VLGDVHRAVRHGRGAGDTGRGLRAVGWERVAGQVVQLALAAAVLLVLPSPFRASVPVLLAAGAAVAVLLLVVLRGTARRHSAWVDRVLRAARADVRAGLLDAEVWPGVAVASVVAVVGHLATFLVAARAAGVTASPVTLLPVALLVLLAMAVPANVAGWGPREGVAAWAFGVAGLGVGQGITTAVVYGVLALVVSLPGALVLGSRFLRGPADPSADDCSRLPVATGGGPHG
jgi:hypothetical protein